MSKLDQTKVQFTEPYIDAGSGLVLISSAKAVKRTDGTLFGVVSVDISMNSVASFVNAGTVLQNGYSYLVDTQGRLIVYPNLERDRVYTLTEREFSSSAEADAFTNSVFPNMVSMGSGQQEFTKGGSPWTVTYARVNGTDYILAMVVPNSDITRSTDQIQTDSTNGLIGAVVAISLLVVAGVVIYLVLSIRVSKQIADGVNEVTEIFQNVNEDKLDIELGNVDSQDGIQEVTEIRGKAIKLVSAVQFANMNIQKGNADQAIRHLEAVETILQEYDNRIGQGVVFNNKAYAYQLQENLDKALENMNLAIQNAQTLYDGEEAFDNAKQFFLVKLAMRNMGLGLIYTEMNRVNEAEAAFDKSCELNDKADNSYGKVKTLGNWARLYMKTEEHSKAFEKYNEAYEIAFGRIQAQNTPENQKILHVASYNMAFFFLTVGDLDQANLNVTNAFQIAQTGSQQRKCIALRAKILDDSGNQEKANAIRREFGISAGSKHVMFVLDKSGSMAGSRINNCQAAMKTVVNDHMNDMDTVSYMAFSSRHDWKLRNVNVAEEKQRIIASINSTKASGGTAFYDAMDMALTTINSNKQSNKAQWVVALSDGEDGSPPDTHEGRIKNIERMIRENEMNVIVIGAMLDEGVARKMRRIAGASEKGLYISADNVEGITVAFQKAAEVINEAQMALESL